MYDCLEHGTREGNGSGSVENPSFPVDPPPSRGGSDPSQEGTSARPRLPSRASAAILSPGAPRADVWGGRGMVVVPRGVAQRAVARMPSGAYWKRYIFKDPSGHRLHYRTDLYNNDFRCSLSFILHVDL